MTGTKESPWQLKTPGGQSGYVACSLGRESGR